MVVLWQYVSFKTSLPLYLSRRPFWHRQIVTCVLMTCNAGVLLQLMWQIRCPMWMPSSRKLYACMTLPPSCFDGPWKTSWWTATLSLPKYVFHHIVQLLCNCSQIGRGGRGEGGWDKQYTALLLPPHMLSPHLRSLNSHAHDWIKSMVGSTTATDVFQQARSVSSKAARFQPLCILCQGYRPSQCQCLQGWTIQLHLAGSQRNIKSFEANASEFKPERFLSTDNKLHR